MSDSHPEPASMRWVERLVESLGAVLLGGVLSLLAFPLLFWNEGRASYWERVPVEGQPNFVNPAHEGKLVHVTGLATTEEVLKDDQLGVEVQALRLERRVLVYQWQEDHSRPDGTPRYTKVWSEAPIDSTGFEEPTEHHNPPRWSDPYQPQIWRAERVHLGYFQLPRKLIDQVPAEPVALSPHVLERFPRANAVGWQLTPDGQLFLGRNLAHPEIGDARMEYWAARPQTVSVLAWQTKATFEPYSSSGESKEDEVMLLEPGVRSVAEMVPGGKQVHGVQTWPLRLLGLLLLAAGLFLMLRPLAAGRDMPSPLESLLGAGAGFGAGLGALALTLMAVALGWLFVRPLLGLGLLTGALALVLVLVLIGGLWRMPQEPEA